MDEQRTYSHAPVMPREVLEYLAPKPGGRYLDGTLGLGGHARLVLEAAEGAELIGLDRDLQALERARAGLTGFGDRLHTANETYARFPLALEDLGWERIDGALLDLGVSSLQLDDPDRGFSFLRDGPLDMRMNPTGGDEPARNIVNKASFERMRDIIRDLGEEPMAGRIARLIVSEREEEPIETTLRLASIVERAYPAKWKRTGRTHPATKTFQALRMAVNRELDELSGFLDRIPDWLAEGGRVVVISFHSLEDRIVKRAFRHGATECVCPPRQPLCTCEKVKELRILTKKPLVPTQEEQHQNPRSRSAKLRAAERLPREVDNG
jgi:16S rRNA (cytosine1402-N4)-methyltransferase